MAIEIKSTKLAGESATIRGRQSFFSFSLRPNRISGKDRMFFTERLALLLETGGALHPSLLALKEQTDGPLLTGIIGDLADDVVAGKSFSKALARHPEMFSSTYVNLIDASEKGGFMHIVLKELQKMEEKREKLRSVLISSLSYPAFLVVFSIAVVTFILTFVFPKFGALFDSIRNQLPITTVFLMHTSEILRRYWLIITMGVTAMGFAFWHWRRSPNGREIVDRLKLKIPVVNHILIQIYLVQVTRVLSLSLANGVSVVDALKSCREVVDNIVFQGFMSGVETQVVEGRGIALGFEKGEFVPSLVRQMIRTGEESGNLAVVTDRIADFYEREMEKNLTLATKIVEPLMLLIMGLVVGLIVTSLILPIFKLTKAVH